MIAEPATVETTPRATAFYRTRVASFLAIVPLGIWTSVHLWNQLYAFQGAAAWQERVTHYPDPVAETITLIIVLAPLLIHTVWGLQRLASFKANNTHYPYYANHKYLLQRLAAIGVLLFLGAHIWRAFLNPRLVEGHAETFAGLANEMYTNPPTLVVYLLGTLGVAYHLANGISGVCWTFGITGGRAAFRKVDVVAIILFVALLAMAWLAIYALWHAGAVAAAAQ